VISAEETGGEIMGLADKKLKMGIAAVKEGRKGEARGLLKDATRLDPSSWKAWLWLSRAAEDRETQKACLEKVLEINPENTLAQRELEALGGPREEAEEIPSQPTDILRESLLAQRKQADVLERLVDQQERLLGTVNTIRSAAIVWLLLVGIGILLGCILAATGSGLMY
jgi:tetratricopeptide (TPR) repeat protein